MCWAHKPVPAGSLFQQVLSCPGLVHDARIDRQWLLPEATPASQVKPHSITHNYSTWCWELVTITYSGLCLRWHKLAVHTVTFNMGHQCLAKMNVATLDSSEHAQEISELMSMHTNQRPIPHKHLCKQPCPDLACHGVHQQFIMCLVMQPVCVWNFVSLMVPALPGFGEQITPHGKLTTED